MFDICDDALVVTNDGVFRDDDFDRLQRVASGGKRDEIGTTGAFGIDFLEIQQKPPPTLVVKLLGVRVHITPQLTHLIQRFWEVWETDSLIQRQRAEHQRRIARATELLQPERIPQLTREEIAAFLEDTDNWHGLRWNKEKFWERVFGVADVQLPQLRQNLAELVQRAERGLTAEDFNTLKMIPGIGPGYLSEILALRFPERYWLWNKQVRLFFAALGIDIKADLLRGEKSDEGKQYLAVGRRLDELRQALSSGADFPVNYMLSDLFMYWANQQVDWKVGAEVSYWKIAPGEKAWNWEACREGGFIAMGWDELGDLSDISREEFEQRCAAALQEHPDWKQSWLVLCQG